jgi:murein L,D-transpeptidase YafK
MRGDGYQSDYTVTVILMTRLNLSNVLVALSILLIYAAIPAIAELPPSNARSTAAIARARPELERELADTGLRWGSPVFIRIFKQEEALEVWVKDRRKFRLFRTYPICRYSGALGPKLREGDGQAPEGFYFVRPRAMNPSSAFHLSFDIGYPNSCDRYHERTGSAIMVHGSCVSIGCFAMTDDAIEEIYALADAALRGGQTFFRIHIFPFRMTRRNLERSLSRRLFPLMDAPNRRWSEFWSNLKEGHDFFEERRVPPDVRVVDGRYVFR